MLNVTGSGRVTSEFRLVELRNSNTGEKFFACDVPLACDRGPAGKDNTFITVSLTGPRARASAQHLVIGQTVTFSGDLIEESYPIKNGPRAGETGHAMKVNRISTWEFGAKPQKTKGPACPALFVAPSARVVTELPVESAIDAAEGGDEGTAEWVDLVGDLFEVNEQRADTDDSEEPF
jgi:hypothetical protein